MSAQPDTFQIANKMLSSDKPKKLIGAFRIPGEMGKDEWVKFDNREWVWDAHPQDTGEYKGLIFGVRVDDTQPHIDTMYLSPEMFSALWLKRKIVIR